MATIDIDAHQTNQVFNHGTYGTWAATRALAGTHRQKSESNQGTYTYFANVGADWNQIRRTSCVFNLTALSGYYITDATLQLYRAGAVGTLDDETDLRVVPTYPTDPANMAAADYALAKWDMATPLTDSVFDTSAATLAQYYSLALNADGEAYLNTLIGEANAHVGVVMEYDRTNTSPTLSSKGWTYEGGNPAGTANEPILSLVYGDPPAGDVEVSPPSNTQTNSIPVPTIAVEANVAAVTGDTANSMPAPLVDAGAAVIAFPPAGEATNSLPTPTISIPASAVAPAGETAGSIPTPSTAINFSASPPVGATTNTIPAPTVTAAAVANASPPAMESTGSMPTPAAGAATAASASPPVFSQANSMPLPVAGSTASVSAVVAAGANTLLAPRITTSSQTTMIDEQGIMEKIADLLGAVDDVAAIYIGLPNKITGYPAIAIYPVDWREEFADTRDTTIYMSFKVVVIVNLNRQTLTAQTQLREIVRASREILGAQENMTLGGLVDSSRLPSGNYEFAQNESMQGICEIVYNVRKRFNRF